ncbi:hypothetical protein CLF_110748, partial [Clonorchis sinensis]
MPLRTQGETLEVVDHYPYLRSSTSPEGSVTDEVNARIPRARNRSAYLQHLRYHKSISPDLKVRACSEAPVFASVVVNGDDELVRPPKNVANVYIKLAHLSETPFKKCEVQILWKKIKYANTVVGSTIPSLSNRFRLRNSGDPNAAAKGCAGVCIVLIYRVKRPVLDWIPIDGRPLRF